VGKYFNISITDESLSFSLNEAVITQDAALDGVYIIRTSVSAQTLDAAQTVRAYKSLSQVELAFRSYKTVEKESASNLSPFRTEGQSSCVLVYAGLL
jgi:hypothetical protein